MSNEILLETKNVSKIYQDGHVTALDSVSLTVHSGEILLIKGPSGCGKSTLLHILGGLDSPSSGTVLFKGQPIQYLNRKKEFRLKNFGFIFQAFYLWHNLSVMENVMLPIVELPLSQKQRLIRAQEIINEVGLQEKINAPIKNLSMGQRQRVAIARALIAKPQIILADEPTGSLDSQNCENILQLLRTINLRNLVTIVIITHANTPQAYFDRQINLLDGKVCL